MTPDEMRETAQRWRMLARGQDEDVEKALLEAAPHQEAEATGREQPGPEATDLKEPSS